MLAEGCENESLVERYRGELDEWKSNEFDRTAIAHWSLDDFWSCSKHENHLVRDRTRRFVHGWCELVYEKDGEVADLQTARALVRERENRSSVRSHVSSIARFSTNGEAVPERTV